MALEHFQTIRNKGVTLLELIAALSLSALVGLLAFTVWRGGFSLSLKVLNHRKSDFEIWRWSSTLSRQVGEGKGLISFSHNSLSLLDAGGGIHTYAMRDTLLEHQGEKMSLEICDFSVDAQGSLSPDPSRWDGKTTPADSLDFDGNGEVDFSELDTDHDGILQESELLPIRIMVIRFRACGFPNAWHQIVVEPHSRKAKTESILAAQNHSPSQGFLP